MRRRAPATRTLWCLAWSLSLFSIGQGFGQSVAPAQADPGLKVSLRAGPGNVSDVMVLPGVCLYVPKGESPSPFLLPGPFQANWTGLLTVELRGEYQFQAEVSGQFTLEVNGQRVLESGGGRTEPSPAIRLAKGTNLLTATFVNRPNTDGWVRLSWIPKGSFPAPIPPANLWHLRGAPDLQHASEVRWGRELFIEHRCVKCHRTGSGQDDDRKEELDAPSLENIGERRGSEWLVDWITDPRKERPLARMPQVFLEHPQEHAGEVAAFLASLGGDNRDTIPSSGGKVPLAAEEREAGRQLFDKLHCVACHTTPGSAESDPGRISLRTVARKFVPGSLAPFLQAPEALFHWIRMPNFKLSADEAAKLAAYLTAEADHAPSDPKVRLPERIARGRELVQTSGCLNCHALKLENQFSTKSLQELPPVWEGGCLRTAASASRAPFYGFSDPERKALQAFGQSDRAALSRKAALEFAQRNVQTLRCSECHGKFEGFPSLESVGAKLRADWCAAFIAGDIKDRPRPWLDARKPAVPAYAGELARGLALMQGFPTQTPPEEGTDPEAARIGQRLVSADGGLSCISCHAIGRVKATQVFENAGINLAYAHARLLKPYFQRWVRNPLALDPVSKMPVFFDEQLRSPLTDFYDGDGGKQIEAIWQYLWLGERMPPPPGTEAGP